MATILVSCYMYCACNCYLIPLLSLLIILIGAACFCFCNYQDNKTKRLKYENKVDLRKAVLRKIKDGELKVEEVGALLHSLINPEQNINNSNPKKD